MKVGIVSPSAGVMGLFPKRVKRGLDWFRSQGWEPILSEYALGQQGYLSASAEHRTADIHRFLDSDVDMILASIGGYNCNQLLPLLDYAKIYKADKIFCGYSDITALLLATAIKSNARCIYGPTFLPELCEFPQPYSDTVDCLKHILSRKKVSYMRPVQTVSEFIDWMEEETDVCRKKAMTSNDNWTILQKGTASGAIWGGNLQTLLLIIGTEYFPLSVLNDAIFFFEDLEKNPAILDAMLQSLKIRGVFERISGLIVGRFISHTLTEQMHRLIPTVVARSEIPILCDVDIGHVNPMLSIPMGAKTFLQLDEQILWQTNGF